MTDASTPQAAESPIDDRPAGGPRVRVLLSTVESADLEAALAVVGRQVYEPAPDVVVVGSVAEDLPEGVGMAGTLEEAITSSGHDIDYLWLLHSDARPRPDALGALVSELERNDAALAGSKLLVAGTENELESVGGATDVFGEPYSGLDEGEIDLQQYDVVREVGFVGSASMLVRRDLAQGLKGLDVLLPPVAAGLDFSQRARLAGGRVISVPSSEVYHQGRCEQKVGHWREQAGQLRAMLTAYRLLTVLWVIPFEFLVGVADSIANLLLLRPRPAARHAMAWGWNTFHLPSTIGLRRRFRPVRSLGDEELFRFQVRGSVRLRDVGTEISGRVLSVFDEDQALARGSRRVWGSPGIWGAVVSTLILLFAARSILFGGMPNVGWSFPFEPPTVSLERWFAGWNESGLGSPSAVHPSTGLTGLFSLAWFGAEGAARVVLTVVLGVLGVVGMGRLAGRLGLRGPGRYLAGLVLLAGPGTALLTGAGSWLALAGASALPWAVRAVFGYPGLGESGRMSRFGWAAMLGVPLAALSPALVVVALLAVVVWKTWGGKGSSVLLAMVVLVGALAAAPFLLGDPGWLLDAERRIGLAVADIWPGLIGVAFLPLLFMEDGFRRVGTLGGLLSMLAMVAVLLPYGGPGVEEAALVTASFGAALVVAAGLDALSTDPRRIVAVVASLAVLVLSIGTIGNGRLGLPSGDVNNHLEFAATLAGESGPGRVLVATTQRDEVLGEARPGPGFWYRVVDGSGTTSDEILLPPALPGDQSLDDVVARIATGAELRPGELLAPFAIDWVVLFGPRFRLDDVFEAQLDLVPTPLDPVARVFGNPASAAMADAGFDAVWGRDGTGFAGESGSGRVTLSVNHDAGWQPEPGPSEWKATVSGAEGAATFSAGNSAMILTALGPWLFLLGLGLVIAGRTRR